MAVGRSTSSELDHPAKFSTPILSAVNWYLWERFDGRTIKVLDPFAGTGRVHELSFIESYGVELEPEWSSMHARNLVGNALCLPFRDRSFRVVFTSPVYGNRMSDHHNARDKSKRHTYRHYLGRALHPDNAGQLQWGKKYRAFHRSAWAEAHRVLEPGGLLILNASDHIRNHKRQFVVGWHIRCLQRIGFRVIGNIPIRTARNKHGRNGKSRVRYEYVIIFEKKR